LPLYFPARDSARPRHDLGKLRFHHSLARRPVGPRKTQPLSLFARGWHRTPPKRSFYQCFAPARQSFLKTSAFINVLPACHRFPQKLSLYQCFAGVAPLPTRTLPLSMFGRPGTASRKNSAFINVWPAWHCFPQKLGFYQCFATGSAGLPQKLSLYQCFGQDRRDHAETHFLSLFWYNASCANRLSSHGTMTAREIA